jgi:carbamoyltransferase
MLILGLNAYHADSAACVLRDGCVIAAAEEERFRRVKHWAGLPTEAVRSCLNEARATPEQVDIIAVNRKPAANLWRRALFLLSHRPERRLISNRLANLHAAHGIDGALHAAFPGEPWRAKIHYVEHHLAHLASAYAVSGFEDAACLSVDGFGDFTSAAWGTGRAGTLHIDERIYFPHSLGLYYSALTQYLGFSKFGDEYKVMGLAAAGQPRFLPQLRQVVKVRPDSTFALDLKYFRHHRENVSHTWNGGEPQAENLFSPELEVLLGPARLEQEPLETRHRDLACSVQAIYEEAFFALLNAVFLRYGYASLALAGGCALNSVANGKICLRTPFRQVYVPPAAGDAGGAVGAALVAWAGAAADPGGPKSRKALRVDDPYLGPAFDDAFIEQLLESRGLFATGKPTPGFSISRFCDPVALCRAAAQAIAAGRVVGWFQGRMEWGPRALGNRSILCDPRRADMKQILNATIKRRESFRPFAPAILREHVAEWFEQDHDVPFMSQVFQIRPQKRSRVPAITHVDGSGRLQTVHQHTNPLFHMLVCEFHALTAVPMVLNTSFNENEPVVCRPEEALDCFLRTRMDMVVLGSFVVSRTTRLQAAPAPG